MPFETFVHVRTLTTPPHPTPTPSLYSTPPLPPPPPPPPKKKKKKKVFFCQIRILCQFIEKYLPLKKMGSLSNKFTKPPAPPDTSPPPPPLAQTTHTSPHTPPIFFSHLDYLPTWISVSEFFLKIDKESKYKKNLFFSWRGGGGGGGGRGLWRGRCEHNVQMLKMALLLFKDYKCAKLFRNTCSNTKEMVQTSSIYDHFII